METTREDILKTAEILFARQGYAETSLRQITEEAGVNIAAVNYHFRSKENLLVEILDRIVAPLNSARLELLDEFEADGIPGVEQILTAFLLPDLQLIEELRGRDPDLPRFVSRMYSEASDLMARVVGRQFGEVQERFYAAFGRAIPDATREDIAWRLHCVVGIVLFLFASVRPPGSPLMVGEDIKTDLRRLLEVTTPVMVAASLGVVTSKN